MGRPEPPLSADSPDDLLDSVRQQPNEWLIYLRNTCQYTFDLENQVSALQTTITAERRSAHTEAAERDGIIRYQKEQFELAQKEIRQLTIEKSQITAAASPAVNTPTTVPISHPVIEGCADDLAGRTAIASASHSGRGHLSEKLPDLREFDGSRNDLRRFTQQIYGKLTANADRFLNATARMTYVAGRLTGRAYELMLPKTAYGIPQFIDYEDMLLYLEKAFGDPDRVQNAQNRLFSLKQKNQDFSVYFSEFQRLALEGEMSEGALTPLLFQGISRELQDMLLHSPAPSNKYSAYAQHLQMLDICYRQH